MMQTTLHQPVLVREVVEALEVEPGGIYVDCTFGRGGHSCEILKRLNRKGCLLVLDQDPDAIAYARQLLGKDCRVRIEYENFARVSKVVEKYGFAGKVNGILFDLGLSSAQLDDPKRGFSFLLEGSLDMRMNTKEGITAADWLQRVNFHSLEEVLRMYGEERYSKRIAAAIISRKSERPLSTTRQLADVVSKAIGRSCEKKHPATRTFQAIRIFINQELKMLKTGLNEGIGLLAESGRMLVITFHSLEDQVVKSVFRTQSHSGLPRKLPAVDLPKPKLRRVCKPIFPSQDEIISNSRARSAKLHVLERIA